MPVVLVIIVVAAWIAILAPNLAKRRDKALGGTASITHFHRQLRVLESSAPQPIVAPAFRLRDADGSVPADPSHPGACAAPVLQVVGADQLPRPALAFLGDDPTPAPASATGPVPPRYAQPVPEPVPADAALLRAPDPYARHLARRRRRDTLGVLAMVFVVTLMIGFVPGAGVAWTVSALSGVALVAYVALLVHLRRRAEERERKLHYLQPAPARAAEPVGAVGVPVYMSGRYAHPSNQAASAR
jgi:hypothetical protein